MNRGQEAKLLLDAIKEIEKHKDGDTRLSLAEAFVEKYVHGRAFHWVRPGGDWEWTMKTPASERVLYALLSEDFEWSQGRKARR